MRRTEPRSPALVDLNESPHAGLERHLISPLDRLKKIVGRLEPRERGEEVARDDSGHGSRVIILFENALTIKRVCRATGGTASGVCQREGRG